jgi:hypothetical protein
VLMFLGKLDNKTKAGLAERKEGSWKEDLS